MDRSETSSETIRDFVKARAKSLGFCLCGITDASPLDHFNIYQQWIQKEYFGEMKYLATERHSLPRQDPKKLIPWAKTIIVFAWPYPLTNIRFDQRCGQIAGYAIGKDYHQSTPEKIEELVNEIKDLVREPFQSHIYTDSSALLERELAVRAGLGWIGRNSCLINPKFGSSFLLAELVLDLKLPVDQPFSRDFCGKCHRCLESCPTQCIQEDRLIDARDCISTLTIENKGPLPIDKQGRIGNRLFGCDTCQSVCPWNHTQIVPQSDSFSFSIENMLKELKISDLQFKEKYAASPILRAKRRGWIRNLCSVFVNLQIVESISPLEYLLENEKDPLILSFVTEALTKLGLNTRA